MSADSTENIHIPVSTGRNLAGVIALPPSGEPRGIVVFAHCFTCGKDIRAAREISRALVESGWGMLRFDFTGLGDSEGSFAEGHFAANISDLIDVADHLLSRREDARYIGRVMAAWTERYISWLPQSGKNQRTKGDFT